MNRRETGRDALIAELQAKASRAELTEQKLRDIYNKLDMQLEKFQRIHLYAMNALKEGSADSLYDTIAEGVVDIFQLECAAFFKMELLDNALLIRGCSGLSLPGDRVPLPKDWVQSHHLLSVRNRQAAVESPVASAPWKDMGLAHVLFMPLFDNDRRLEAVIMGGVSQEKVLFYEFVPNEILSSFMVYCQLMNGILNNSTALEKARSSALAKSRFLANLSHEIRTPMNAITGMVQLAAKSSDSGDLKKFIAQIDLSSRHLLGLLNEVLDIAKIDEGKFTLTEEVFELKAIAETLLSTFAPGAAKKGLRLRTNTAGVSALTLKGDSLRLTQVLMNLLSNAVKFTPEGGEIRFSVEEISRDNDKVHLRFEVADTGIGISQEGISRLFTPFEQEDGGISRKYGGTGLGLAVSQRIVELMGGVIQVRSVEGAGSRFSFHLVLPLAEEALSSEECGGPADPPCRMDFSPYRVLIVDDISINRDIASALLEDTGIQREEAENGQEAVEAFLRSQPGYFDIILMDMQMPVLDGCNAARIIRASGRPDAAGVIILAMTANVFTESVNQVMDAGMDGYIPKPVEYDTMVKSMERFLSKIHGAS